MIIVHTADWHLGGRLGRIDRGDDLRKAVSRVMEVCLSKQADVLLICGDLFDNLTRSDLLRQWVEYLSSAFAPFFVAGGTVLALTGNHDNEHVAHMLRGSMTLASPAIDTVGATLPTRRFHLFPGPTFFRLPDRHGQLVQFIAMPWPMPARYLDDPSHRFQSLQERNRALKSAFKQRLDEICQMPGFDRSMPTVLSAHIMTAGAEVREGFTIKDVDALVINDNDLPVGFAYVALGDVHKPQCLRSLPHVRYAGSIERMDLGEANDQKGVVVVEVGPAGLVGLPLWTTLDASTVDRVEVSGPADQLESLKSKYPDHEHALVNLHVKYRPGRDNLHAMLATLDDVFPRWYRRECQEERDMAAAEPVSVLPDGETSLAATVRQFLVERLERHPDRDKLFVLADARVQQGWRARLIDKGAAVFPVFLPAIVLTEPQAAQSQDGLHAIDRPELLGALYPLVELLDRRFGLA